MGIKKVLSGDQLYWDLMKFCRGYRPSEIDIFTIRNGEDKEMKLSNIEGEGKEEKLKTLTGVIDIKYFEEIEIVLPTCLCYCPYETY